MIDSKDGDYSTKGKGDTPVLNNFAKDLIKLAEEGKLDPVVGRDREITRIAQILSRRKKNNPIIIGEPGCGKTAIVEGLALKILNGECPRNLMDKRIMSLDITSIVAGTKYRGQFEERMKVIIDELQNAPNIILFIDEIHQIVGAGNSSGSLDASNIFKPALARGEIQCIGATTLDEYRKNFEKDGALERRFQKVVVDPSTKEETLQILINVKEKYETYHKVSYSDEVLKLCVDLAERYITDREFPDKAFDIIDEVGARSQVEIKMPKIIEDLKLQALEIKQQKIDVVKNQNYELAADLRDKETKILDKLDEEKKKFESDLLNKKKQVTTELVYEVVSNMTKIPVSKMTSDETNKLSSLADNLESKVIGQSEAVSKIAKAIRRNRLGIKDPSKPIGSFIFLGSSSPPGYVGYDEGGQLTETVKNKPYSVILFDEIEKANKDVFSTLLQVLDDGHLTDGLGRKINFKNCVIIMTSNLGVKKFQEFGTGVGFKTSTNLYIEEEQKRDLLKKELKKFFAPEFLNRIDEIIVFNSLKEEEIKQIVKLEIDKLIRRLNGLNYDITCDEKVLELISKVGFDETFGARPIKRAIQDQIEDFISEEVLNGKIVENEKYSLTVEDDKVILNVVKKGKKKKGTE